jgi:hypothetical protein
MLQSASWTQLTVVLDALRDNNQIPSFHFFLFTCYDCTRFPSGKEKMLVHVMHLMISMMLYGSVEMITAS